MDGESMQHLSPYASLLPLLCFCNLSWIIPLCFQLFTMSHSRYKVKELKSVYFIVDVPSFFFFFTPCRRLYVCESTHTKHIPQGGVNIKESVWGCNPFEMQLSVITHRQGWNRAWLWGVTLPRCLAPTLTLPGLQQSLHTGILVLPLLCVPTNYPFKDGI